MGKSRRVVFTCMAVAAALLVTSALLSGPPRWFGITAFIFVVGLAFGAMISNKSAASKVTAHATDGTAGAVGVFFDVTRLERLELIRQEFLSNVSHELRTPLTSIVALAETLEAGALDDPENNRRFLAIIQKNAARMHRLIDDILELSAIEAGNVKLQRESIQLQPLVEDIISSVSTTAAARNIKVSNLVQTSAEVFADPHRLMQMLTNLIDNAIKFNRDSGTVSVTFKSGDYDRISVEDTGEGIPSHHLDRLFVRFYRVDRARSRELGGTGLDLAIVML